MTDSSQDRSGAVEQTEGHARLRRYASRVTIILFVLCNAIIAFGVWVSGVNLDGLFRTPDLFNPSRDVCLRFSWHKVAGVPQPVQLCYEWINLSDPSGNTHTFHQDTDIVLGADGRLHYDHGARVDYRFFTLIAFVAVVIVWGLVFKRFLIMRYRLRLETTGNLGSPMLP